MSENTLFRVTFFNQGQVYEVYAREVSQGGIFGFVEIGGLVFGARSQVVVDPSEERLKTEFEGVRRFHVPLHSVIRVDEVEKEGASRITTPDEGSNVAPFPVSLYRPGGGEGSGKS